MTELNNKLRKLDFYFRKNRNQLLTKKVISVSFFILFFGLQYPGFYPEEMLNKEQRETPMMDQAIIQIILVILFTSPVLFMPLTSFWKRAKRHRFSREIKKVLFDEALSKYDASGKLSLSLKLPVYDLKNLGLHDGTISPAEGDDLVSGKINGYAYRISEIHARKNFKRTFDGLIAVLDLQKQHEMDFLLKPHRHAKKRLEFEVINQRLYIKLKGNKTHFEYKIRHQKINRKQLQDDYKSFDLLVSTLNNITLDFKKLTHQ